MKATPFTLCALALVLLSACVTQDVTKLRVGMTKDEVIKIMGKPNGVGVDGAREYLVYEIPKGPVTNTRNSAREFDPLGSGTASQTARPVTTSPYSTQTQPSTVGYSRTGFDTKSNVIPKADYDRPTDTRTIYEKYSVVLENGKVIAFGTKQQLRNWK